MAFLKTSCRAPAEWDTVIEKMERTDAARCLFWNVSLPGTFPFDDSRIGARVPPDRRSQVEQTGMLLDSTQVRAQPANTSPATRVRTTCSCVASSARATSNVTFLATTDPGPVIL